MNRPKDSLTYKATDVSWSVSTFLSEEPTRVARRLAVLLILAVPILILFSMVISVPIEPGFSGVLVSSNQTVLLKTNTDLIVKEIHVSPRKFIRVGEVLLTTLIPNKEGSESGVAPLLAEQSGFLEFLSVKEADRLSSGSTFAGILPTEFDGLIESVVDVDVWQSLEIGQKLQVSLISKGQSKDLQASVQEIIPVLSPSDGQATGFRKLLLKLESDSQIDESFFVGQPVEIRKSNQKQSVFKASLHRLLKKELVTSESR